MILNEREKLALSENAYKDYISGMKYKDIAEKYEVSLNTVKSWQKRYKWSRSCTQKKGCKGASVQNLGNNKVAVEIKEDLLKQLKENETHGKHYEDLVNDYMALWDIKNRLIADIKERGVSVEWNNGKQVGMKKNDSIPELNKTSAQMLKILSELGLKPSPKVDDYDDI
ncbi:P27 family phage terminase small subunit [Clostridium ihumii]|uniref:P27 family phage terminase small subunit n=1 Tax=Clostridium ihumii TaxID=1470356 RepID=UPI003BF955A1